MDVAAWLRDLGLERYAPAFLDAEITPEALPELTDADLRELGLPLGPRKVRAQGDPGPGGPAAPTCGDQGGSRAMARADRAVPGRAAPAHGHVRRPGRLDRALHPA